MTATPYPPRDWLWCRTCDGSGLGTLEEPICPTCDGAGKVPDSRSELEKAIDSARGGPAPIPLRGFA